MTIRPQRLLQNFPDTTAHHPQWRRIAFGL
jgi:hypothetical protein